jgi:alpha-L-rhamnosidase
VKRACLVFVLACAPSFAATVSPRELRCEYRVNPLGIDVTEPRLSWLLAPTGGDGARGLRQAAYHLLVASSERGLRAGTGDLWDSGRVPSADSTQVVYRGKALGSGVQAFWKVQVWDQDGKPSEWSAPAMWSMGLLHASDWGGHWIGHEETGLYEDPDSQYHLLKDARWIWDSAGASAGVGHRYFRTRFSIPPGRRIVRAVCIAGAANTADAYINGQTVIQRSNTSVPQVSEVSGALHAGENVLAVEANHTDAARPGGAIAALRVEFDSGEPLVVRTGAGWRASAASAAGWAQTGFDDSAWPAAASLGDYGIQPWGQAGFTGEHRLPARYLRKEFAAAKKVRRATVYYSGLGLSELYLNGAKVGDHVLSPGLTDYDKHVLYVTFDVTRQIAAGRNAIGLVLGNGRYYAPRLQEDTRNFDYPKALLELDLEYEDGSRASFVTDQTWKLTTAGPIRADNEYDGEEYDARMERTGWDRAGFDDSAWEAARAVPAPGGILASEMAEPLRVVETLHPMSVKQIRPGVYLFDMGQNLVGWCRLRAAGPRGATIRLRHAETLAPDGGLYVDNLRTARATDLYTLKGEGTEVWEPRFTYHGFRYVEMTGFPGPGAPTAAALEGRVVHDDMRLTADFRSSSEILNRIHHNIVWGIRGNYRSIPTDCPQRDERQGWLGDRSQVSFSESYIFDVAAFYTKWERDIMDAQTPEGSVPDVAPNFWPRYNDDITWPSTLLWLPGMLYSQYGDRRVLEQAYPAMQVARTRTHLPGGRSPN